MGVTQLWQILAPVQEHKPLSSLAGQTLAVDLSIWVCETQSVKQMQGIVAKPFLRNLFFRISHLTQLGVKLVFVVDGTAPELKWEAMTKRQQVRFPGRQGKQTGLRQGRRNFNSCLKECCKMLDILGIPYAQSQGEAEAMCAVLNAAGLVDGCLTNDGDAFLYGATVVYRNFTMNTKDPHVESYRMADIQAELGIDRDGLVGLALLLGCDYIPKGVPGIGHANAVKLMQVLRGRNVLSRLREWKSISETECFDQVEVLMRRKAISVPEFPQEKVINEFLISKDKCPRILPSWKRPIINQLQAFALDKMEWPVEYSLEKVLPLVTLWDMRDILQSPCPSSALHLKPHRILKARVRQGIPCYEVEWHKPVSDSSCPDEYYTTVEEQDVFSRCHKQIVDNFSAFVEEKKIKKSSKGTRKKKKVKDPKPSDIVMEPSTNIEFSSKFDSSPITDELSKSFAALTVAGPNKVDSENSDFVLGDDSHKTSKFPKNTPEMKHSNDKIADSRILPVVKKQQQGMVLTEFTTAGTDSTNNKDTLDKLDDSNNDSFIPLSLRVKKKLQEKKAVAKYDTVDCFVVKKDLSVKKDTTSLKSHYEKCVNEDDSFSDNAKAIMKVTDLSNFHPSFNDSSRFSAILENGCAENVSADRGECAGTASNESVVEHLYMYNHSGGTPKSVCETKTNTPLSLQKEFINDNYGIKVSSPVGEKFCSPVTYIKQTSLEHGEMHSLIEVEHTPDFRKTDKFIAENILSGCTSAENMNTSNHFSMCRLITDCSDKNESLSAVFDNPSKNLNLDGDCSKRGQHFEVKNCIVSTPLYSLNNCRKNCSNTVMDPLKVILGHKFEISEMSLLDNPNFDIQTSLLNSLCKSLDQTSPSSIKDIEVAMNINHEVSFKHIGMLPANSASDGSILQLENISYDQEKFEDKDNVSYDYNVAKEVTNVNQISPFITDQSEVQKDSDAEHEIWKKETPLLMCQEEDTRSSRGDICNIKEAKVVLENEYVQFDSSHCHKKSFEKEYSDKENIADGATVAQKCIKIESKDEADLLGTTETLKGIVDSENLKTDPKPQTDIISASQTVRKTKIKNKKGRKKAVKKVSAIMDLSRDSDEDVILSQMTSSQGQTVSESVSKPSYRRRNKCCLNEIETKKEKCDFVCRDEFRKVNRIQEEENISKETLDLCESDFPVRNIEINDNKIKSDTDRSIRAFSAKNYLSAESCVNQTDGGNTLFKTKGEFERIVPKSERLRPMIQKTDSYVSKIGSPNSKTRNVPDHMVSTTVAASPFSLAERLRKRLKDSSTRHILTDFTNF